jgi:hypothetical protein
LVNRLYPQTGLEFYRHPLNPSKARPVVGDWVSDGIPENVILEAIESVCSRIPKGTTVSSMKYFDRAVREAKSPAVLSPAFFEGLK